MENINLNGVVWSHPNDLESTEFYPGVRKKVLFQDKKSSAKVLEVEIDAGSKFLDLDVHEPGSEEVYVISGTFNDGVRDYLPGTFIHNPKGSAHIPQSKDGCKLLVFFPQG